VNEETKFILTALVPPLIFLVFVEFVPIFYSLFFSFTDRVIFETTYKFVGLENYLRYLASSDFINNLINSFAYGLGAAILQTFWGLFLALSLYKHQSVWATALCVILFIPYVIPYVAVALLWTFLLDQTAGPINKWVTFLGISDKPIPFLSSPQLAMPTVILVTSWMLAPFAMLLLYAALRTVPRDQLEAAMIDGAGALETFRHVTWPWIARMFYITLFLRFLFNFGKFDLIWLLTQGGPLKATETFPIRVWLMAYSEYNYGGASAVAVVSLLALMIPLALFVYATREKE